MSDAIAHLKNMHFRMVFTGVLARAPFSKTSKWHVFAYDYCVRAPDIKTIIFCWICDVILGAFSGHSGHFHGNSRTKKHTGKKDEKSLIE